MPVRAAIYKADAIDDAIYEATRSAIFCATSAALDGATRAAVCATTRPATTYAIYNAAYDATDAATRDA